MDKEKQLRAELRDLLESWRAQSLRESERRVDLGHGQWKLGRGQGKRERLDECISDLSLLVENR